VSGSIAESLPAYDALDMSSSCFPAPTLQDCQQLIPQPDDFLSALNTWDPSTHFQQPENTRSALGIWDAATPVPQLDDAPSAPSIWDSTTTIAPSLLIRDEHNSDLDPYWTTTAGCGCPSPHFQVQTQGPGAFSHGKFRILKIEPSATAADPYANSIRIDTVCTTAALYALGIHVCISEDLLCANTSVSPFFRPGSEFADDMSKANIIYAVQRAFMALKPDLRPSTEQITVKHHPYIDILPFPTLRRNLITHQEVVDEDEFLHDMLTGLVCWGGAGIGKKDREISTGYVSTGTPWDVRSWEAKTWFLKKYWRFLGGEDGELVRQSEWWRSIRGDDDDTNQPFPTGRRLLPG
jgi:hypothetical protein